MAIARSVARSVASSLARSVAGSVGGGLLPLQLGASWWLDATDQSIGGGVSLWTDKTSSGYDASQATGGNQPSVVDWGNGNASVSFDGVNDELTISIPQTAVRQVFAVVDTTNVGTGYRSFLERTPSGAPVLLFSSNFAGQNYKPGIYWGADIARQASTVQRKAIFEWGVFDPAYTRIDNANLASTDHAATTLGTWNKICNASAQQARVVIAEVVGFQNPLSDANRLALVSYFQNKWAL